MLSDRQKTELKRQQYRLVGSHSAVKICGWTKKMLRGEGGCYKYKFYGIRSHQCLQMTTSMFCANRCTFCWRGEKAPVQEVWDGPVDNPEEIIENSVKEHLELLEGFRGNPKVAPGLIDEMQAVRHVALSLTGEPVTYPKINEIIDQFHKRRISTFLVTNGQYPEQIERLKPITQLYLSVDAPNKVLLKKIDRPLFRDYYERLMHSLDILAKIRYRTCIRLTVIKGENDTCAEGYAKLILRGAPDFVEVKAYMLLGASRNMYKLSNMPLHEYVRGFAETLEEALPDYEIVSEHNPSRVVLLVKKSSKPYQYIDFKRFFALAIEDKPITIEDCSSDRMTPN